MADSNIAGLPAGAAITDTDLIAGSNAGSGTLVKKTGLQFNTYIRNMLASLPTSDPHILGQLWNNGGVVAISQPFTRALAGSTGAYSVTGTTATLIYAAYPLDSFSGPAADAAFGTFAWSSTAVGQTAVTTDDGSGATNIAIGSNGFTTTGTGQRISKLWNQIGSTYVDQTTLAERPTLWASEREVWPEVRFNLRHGTAATSKKLTVQSAPTARSGQNWTHVLVMRSSPETKSGAGSGNSGFINQSDLTWSLTPPSLAFGLCRQIDQESGSWAAQNRMFTGDGNFVDVNPPLRATLNFSVVVTRLASDNCTIFIDGKKYVIGGTVTTSNATPFQYGDVNNFSILSDSVCMLGAAWFPALTDAQVVEITGLIRSRLLGTSQAAQSLWMFDGDSITAGYDVALTVDLREKSWPYLLMSGMSAVNRAKVTGVNLAVAAAHLETSSSTEHRLMTNRAGKINAQLGASPSYTNKVVVLCAGSNDIYYNGDTDFTSAIMTNLSTYHTDALTAGATRCLICTQIPREQFDATQNGYLATLNASILSTFGADAVDVAAQNWQPGGAGDWTTNYQDGVHPNAAGRQLFVNAITSVMSGLV